MSPLPRTNSTPSEWKRGGSLERKAHLLKHSKFLCMGLSVTWCLVGRAWWVMVVRERRLVLMLSLPAGVRDREGQAWCLRISQQVVSSTRLQQKSSFIPRSFPLIVQMSTHYSFVFTVFCVSMDAG